jgi:hypothetical protein
VLPGLYEPRSPTGTILHHVVRTHLERFLAETAAATDGAGVPRFIEREFRKFLGCGVLSRGFARVRCDACRFERLVPFSCKARAVCPSCGGRRMAEQAAHLVEAVLPLRELGQRAASWTILSAPGNRRPNLFALGALAALNEARINVESLAAIAWERFGGEGVADLECGWRASAAERDDRSSSWTARSSRYSERVTSLRTRKSAGTGGGAEAPRVAEAVPTKRGGYA